MSKEKPSYYYLIFSKIIYEYDYKLKDKIEIKIKRSLKYYKLRVYDQEKVDYIRKFKNELINEITNYKNSKFYKKSNDSKYSKLDDFNLKKMIEYFGKKYDKISEVDLGSMVYFAIYHCYLR
ncbi:MAG: hypothetical protein KDK36_19580 [Leptospiraceae bacterium]|nr:hypothetical protein [Leptospiraceae bacterium]